MATLVCNDCQDCCIDVAYPVTLRAHDSCCYCGEEVEIKLLPNQVIPAGTILGAVTDGSAQAMTYAPFAATNTNGTQYALVILKHDVQTNADGKIVNWSGLWGCGRDTTKAYVCGKFDLRSIKGDVGAAKASGLPVRVINGFVYLG